MQNSEHHQYAFGTIPKRLNDFFKPENRDIVGRTEELAQVRRGLVAGRDTILVNGIGGIGKTTVARKYVEQHWNDYRHVAWLTVNAPQSIGHDPHRAAADEGYSPLRDAFLRSPALWRSLGIETEVGQRIDGKDLGGAFDLVCQRLGQLQDCLLVIDNANDATDLLENRPTLKSLNAHVLVTSRAKPKEWNIVEVNELPLPQAVELFRHHYAHPSFAQANEAELNAMAETLLRHTLLLELVGKSASPDGNNLPFPRLVENLKDQSFHNRYLNEIPVDGGDHADGQNLRRQATVESYIALMFSHIQWEEPVRRDLLKAMTLLPPATAYGKEFLTEICQLLGVDFQPSRAEFLVQYGWLNREPLTEGGVGYSMHPLILDVAFRELGVTAEWADGVIRDMASRIKYDSTNPSHDLREKRNFQFYVEHLAKVFWNSETESISWLLNECVTLERNNGFYANAARLGERGLAIAVKSLSEEIIAIAKSNLAIVYRYLGEYTRAFDLLEAALAFDLKNFGPEHPKISIRQSNLATVCMEIGQYSRARDLLESALASNLKNFGQEHPGIAVSESNLGLVYWKLGKYVRARDLLESALASNLKNFGQEHPSVAVSQSNLANLYVDLGEYRPARDLFEAALVSDLKNFAPNNPRVVLIKSNLGLVYWNLKENARALDLLEAALASNLENFGTEHPNVAVSQSNLANVYGDLKEYYQARDLLESALTSNLKNFGPEFPNIVVIQSNLGLIYRDLGEYARARSLLEKALTSSLKNFGLDHPNIAALRNNLATVYQSEMNYSQAIEQYQEALRILEKTLGREHPNFAITSESLAAAQRAAESESG